MRERKSIVSWAPEGPPVVVGVVTLSEHHHHHQQVYNTTKSGAERSRSCKHPAGDVHHADTTRARGTYAPMYSARGGCVASVCARVCVAGVWVSPSPYVFARSCGDLMKNSDEFLVNGEFGVGVVAVVGAGDVANMYIHTYKSMHVCAPGA